MPVYHRERVSSDLERQDERLVVVGDCLSSDGLVCPLTPDRRIRSELR